MTSQHAAPELARVGTLSRLLSAIERGGAGPAQVERPAGAVIGLVGPPGVGKSSVISELVKRARGRGESVVVLAVDPSSPLSGGALLGDRVRLAEHGDDPLVFVRSFASRGHHGGLAAAIPAAVNAALACGWDRVFIEPVGGGQNDIDIATCSDVVLLVVSPESGDEVQALKAGILEMADVIVVNKADRPGANAFRNALGSVGHAERRPQIMLLSILENKGVDELDELIRGDFPAADDRRAAAHLTSLLNDLVAFAKMTLARENRTQDIVALAQSGHRAEALRAIVKELNRVD